MFVNVTYSAVSPGHSDNIRLPALCSQIESAFANCNGLYQGDVKTQRASDNTQHQNSTYYSVLN